MTPLFGRGYVAGVDMREQRKHNRYLEALTLKRQVCSCGIRVGRFGRRLIIGVMGRRSHRPLIIASRPPHATQEEERRMEEGAGMGRGEMRDKEEERKALVEVLTFQFPH